MENLGCSGEAESLGDSDEILQLGQFQVLRSCAGTGKIFCKASINRFYEMYSNKILE
jgi:hypothetical protein